MEEELQDVNTDVLTVFIKLYIFFFTMTYFFIRVYTFIYTYTYARLTDGFVLISRAHIFAVIFFNTPMRARYTRRVSILTGKTNFRSNLLANEFPLPFIPFPYTTFRPQMMGQIRDALIRT